MNQYRDFWQSHVTNVGAVKAVTGWNEETYTAFYREIFADLAQHKVKSIADVGCGPALLIPLMAELYPTATYTGYDVTPAMIDYASQNNADCEFILVSGELELTVRYDLIICHSVLTHITPTDAETMLVTIKKGLAKGGIASISIHTNCPHEWSGDVRRVDYEPGYFEAMLKDAGLKVVSFLDVAVPAGAARYYRVK